MLRYFWWAGASAVAAARAVMVWVKRFDEVSWAATEREARRAVEMGPK